MQTQSDRLAFTPGTCGRRTSGGVCSRGKGPAMSEQNLKRQIRLFYTFRVFSGGLSCSIPVIVIFWQKHGMNLTDITLLQAIFAILVVALEVPSGYAADRLGRKRVILVGSLASAMGATVYIVAQGWSWFLASEVCFAFGISMMSGADSAWLYDLLLANGQERRYEEIWGRSQSYTMASFAVLSICGGILYEMHNRAPFWLASVLTGLAVLCAVCLQDDVPYEQQNDECKGTTASSMFSILKRNLLGNRAYMRLLVGSALVFAAMQVGLWFYQPYMVLCGVQPRWFGFIFASFHVVAGAASHRAVKLDRWFDRLPLGTAPLLVLAASHLGMGIAAGMAGLPFIYLQQTIRGWLGVSISRRVNEVVAASERATLLSFVSMGNRGAYGLVLPLAGIAGDTWGLPVAMSVIGGTVLAGALGIACCGRTHTRLAETAPIDDIAG